MCNHDFALYFDGEKLRWKCYKCGKYLDETPEKELDDIDKILLEMVG